MREPIEDRIRTAFNDYFDALKLIREYSTTRRHPVELATLACTRLDSLANLAFTRGAQRDRFVRFTETYSGRKSQLERIAIPNLYS
jgi:hypothetical protein